MSIDPFDITHSQLERMEAQAMERKKIDWSWWLDLGAALLLFFGGVAIAILVVHFYFNAPCSFWGNLSVTNMPARCLAEMMAHG